MGLIVQQNLANPVTTKEVWYDGVGGQIAAGYAVCYDPTEGVTESAGEFGELRRFQVVAKPASANLGYFAGIVTDALRQSGTTAGAIVIAVPTYGTSVQARCHVNATVGDPLTVANDDWGLVADAAAATATSGAGAAVYSRVSYAKAGETADTSTTAANKLIFGIL